MSNQRSDIYCMMIHNCSVFTTSTKEKQSNQVQIIDEFGCSLYPLILPHVVYEDDLLAGLASNAFSLDIDQVSINILKFYFLIYLMTLLKF